MVLNSDEVMKIVKDPYDLAMPQQHGVDLTLREVYTLDAQSKAGCVYREKTFPPTLQEVEKTSYDALPYATSVKSGWLLQPGLYSLEFDQGVKIPAHCKANIIHRSSIARCGGQIYSGEYDAGFETENAGAFLVVHVPFFIEEHARVAQLVVQEVRGIIERQYDGQWQGR